MAYGLAYGERRWLIADARRRLRVDIDLDARDLLARRHRDRARPLPFDLANAREEVALDVCELTIGDLTELEPYLGLEQLLAKRGVVLHLRVRRGDDFLEDEPDRSDEQRVQDEHSRA